ncbi:hypothetical protein HID58_015939 [Brassica napus]|uniref:Uncharacterized protein n=1 Tax=Brassica napus TaxID=3708 RepID=A0ABQ8DLH6_BRANA|nr:hypothetical protein HID58_015939 [Brassica napus]
MTAQLTHYKRPSKRSKKTQITNRAQGPPTTPDQPKEAPSPCGQTLRLRRRPPSEHHQVNQPSIHRRESETTQSTHHHRKRLPLRASIASSRSHPAPFKPITEIEASCNPTQLTVVELRTPSYGISTHPNKPEPKMRTNPKTKPRDQRRRGKATKRFHPRDLDRRRSLYLAGTGSGVDGAKGASASRRQNQITERETSPRFPHPDRALAPETEPPWTALFQSSSKAARRGDETKAEINSFTGGWKAPVTARALTRRQSPDPITDLLSLS